MTPVSILSATPAAILLIAAAIVGALPHLTARRLGAWLAAAGSALIAVPAARSIAAGGVDAFRGAALLALCIASTLAVLHGLSYSRSWTGASAVVMAVSLPVFIGAIATVLLASDVVTLLVAWEIMTIASALLVGIDHHEPANREALVWYLSVAHVSPAALILAIASLQPAGFSLTALAESASVATPEARNAAFLLVLVAAAAKAGLVPLHAWLPRAHPAAPSHVSAIMSGAMVVLGAYVFVLFGPVTLGQGHEWWAWAGVAVGTVSAFTGALYALNANDLKRMLAYSTVENMGLVFLELSLWMLGNVTGRSELATLAFAAALAHVIAHAIAKSTLFLGAGSFIHVSGTRLLNRMGGLADTEPLLAGAFLMVAASIAALPPFIGFSGEWLLVRAIVAGSRDATGASGLGLAVVLGIVALTGGIALAAYAKAVGVGLLGNPRKAREAHGKVGTPERIAVGAGATLALVTPVAAATTGWIGLWPSTASPVPEALFRAAVVPTAILAGIGVFSAIAIAVTRGAAFRVRQADAWVCGISFVTPRMQYTSDSFSQPFARVFAAVLRPSVTADVDVHSPTAEGRSYERRSRILFESVLYGPLLRLVRALSLRVRRLHDGRVATYMAWMLVAIVALLAFARWGR